jgi:hypothetical protein
MADKSRLLATYPGSTTRLAEVLAWKTRRKQVDPSNRLEVANVRRKWYARKATTEDAAGTRVDLAQQGGTMVRRVQADLYASDSGKKPGNAELMALSLVSSLHDRLRE